MPGPSLRKWVCLVGPDDEYFLATRILRLRPGTVGKATCGIRLGPNNWYSSILGAFGSRPEGRAPRR
jgi:hypothetical protein